MVGGLVHLQSRPRKGHSLAIIFQLMCTLSLTYPIRHRIVLGKIPTPDGPTNAYTIIRGRWVGELLKCMWSSY